MVGGNGFEARTALANGNSVGCISQVKSEALRN